MRGAGERGAGEQLWMAEGRRGWRVCDWRETVRPHCFLGSPSSRDQSINMKCLCGLISIASNRPPPPPPFFPPFTRPSPL